MDKELEDALRSAIVKLDNMCQYFVDDRDEESDGEFDYDDDSYDYLDVPKFSRNEFLTDLDSSSEEYDNFYELFEASANVENPYERFLQVVKHLEEANLSLNASLLKKVLEILPENREAWEYFDCIIDDIAGTGCEAVGKIFKECGETLEDMPIEYITEPHFLESYLTSVRSDDPDLRDEGFLDISLSRDQIIARTKRGLQRISLQDFRPGKEIEE